MKDFFTKLIATGLGAGHSPIFPGTIGSIIAIAVYFIIKIFLHNAFLPVFIVLFFLIGVFASHRTEHIAQIKDPRIIIIDEIAASLVYLYLIPAKLWCIIIGFILFRLLDIIKPFPIKKLEKLPGGWGIMLDDLAAALYTAALVNITAILI